MINGDCPLDPDSNDESVCESENEQDEYVELTNLETHDPSHKDTSLVSRKRKQPRAPKVPSKKRAKESYGKERDKQGNIIRACGIAGCTYKTGRTGHMKKHKASKHGIEVVWKNDDGKERNKRGQIVRVCGIAGCTYKTGNTATMKRHKAAKHEIDVIWHTCPNCNYKAKEKGSITRHLKLNRCPGK